ncbi:MAG: hypothetical protein WCF03_03765 [Nitrososphaeraceae archaeon]
MILVLNYNSKKAFLSITLGFVIVSAILIPSSLVLKVTTVLAQTKNPEHEEMQSSNLFQNEEYQHRLSITSMLQRSSMS